MSGPSRTTVALLAGLLSLPPLGAGAQVPGRTTWLQPEMRVDAITARGGSAQLAGAVAMPLGVYVRAALGAGGGLAWHHGERGAAQHVDAALRFVLDPFRQSRWAPYGIGGASVRHDSWSDWRTYLLLGVGVEGPERGGIVPALELGLGGGARIGLALRRAIPERR